MHPQGLSRKGVILLILMMFLFSSMLPSQSFKFDAPIVVAGENTVHGKSIAFECSNNISSGDCDHDSLSNIEEDRDGDGNWSNDDSDGDGISCKIILMKTTTTMAGLHGWSVQFQRNKAMMIAQDLVL